MVATRTAQGLCQAAASERPEWLREPSFRDHLLALLLPYLEQGVGRCGGPYQKI